MSPVSSAPTAIASKRKRATCVSAASQRTEAPAISDSADICTEVEDATGARYVFTSFLVCPYLMQCPLRIQSPHKKEVPSFCLYMHCNSQVQVSVSCFVFLFPASPYRILLIQDTYTHRSGSWWGGLCGVASCVHYVSVISFAIVYYLFQPCCL